MYLPCTVNHVGKHIRVKSSGNWSQRFESMSLRKSRRSNQNRKTVADIQFLSLPKRSYRIKYLLYWKHVIVNQRYFYQTLQLFAQAVFNKTNLMANISGEVINLVPGTWTAYTFLVINSSRLSGRKNI